MESLLCDEGQTHNKVDRADSRSSFVNLFLKSRVARAMAQGGTIPPIITAAIIS